MTGERYLNTRKAAKYLGISHSWLAHVRLSDGGPRWIAVPDTRIIRYDIQDLDDWMASLKVPKQRDSVCSSSDYPNHPSPQGQPKRKRGRPTKAETIARRRTSLQP